MSHFYRNEQLLRKKTALTFAAQTRIMISLTSLIKKLRDSKDNAECNWAYHIGHITIIWLILFVVTRLNNKRDT